MFIASVEEKKRDGRRAYGMVYGASTISFAIREQMLLSGFRVLSAALNDAQRDGEDGVAEQKAAFQSLLIEMANAHEEAQRRWGAILGCQVISEAAKGEYQL
jgi:hypothetical protein